MKKIFVALIIIFVLGLFVELLLSNKAKQLSGTLPNNSQNISTSPSNNAASEDIPKTTVIAEGLDTPWAIAFLSENSMLVTERSGRVRIIDNNGNLQADPVGILSNAKEIGEGGLLGISLHPNFTSNHFVYLYYTYSSAGENTLNRVVRMKFENNTLTDETIILDKIPGASNHNGGRIKFGPDGLLYIGTGDAENPSQAQNTSTLGGKILRITDEGKVPSDNPFKNPVFSYGHRNVQGLAWDASSSLWATEHGRSGVLSGFDELNLIEKGKNYGWPTIQGNETKSGMQTPKRNSDATTTWAPAGAAFVGDHVYFAGLRGQALYQASIQNTSVLFVQEHLKSEFGRIREVILGPDNMLYVTTSNRDGRGTPKIGDDKIIRINPSKL